MRSPTLSRLARFVLAAALCLGPACTCTDIPQARPITGPYTDDFNRAALGPDWHPTDPAAYHIVHGELVVKASHNHPMWLTRPIPRDAVIEFDCWSNDKDGDIKVEAWGDGRSFATDRIAAYTSTSYNFIFGGWHNTISTLARMAEHGEDRLERTDVHVVKGRHYHFRIARKGPHIEWDIDGKPFFTYDDPSPLEGPGHSHFAFTDWETELHFDNLSIKPD